MSVLWSQQTDKDCQLFGRIAPVQMRWSKRSSIQKVIHHLKCSKALTVSTTQLGTSIQSDQSNANVLPQSLHLRCLQHNFQLEVKLVKITLPFIPLASS